MSLRKLKISDYMWALGFILALVYGINDIEEGKKRDKALAVEFKANTALCKTVGSKYIGKYKGEYTIINGVLYCKHPARASYDKYPLATNIIRF